MEFSNEIKDAALIPASSEALCFRENPFLNQILFDFIAQKI